MKLEKLAPALSKEKMRSIYGGQAKPVTGGGSICQKTSWWNGSYYTTTDCIGYTSDEGTVGNLTYFGCYYYNNPC
jgi:hypothetical protein